MIGAIIGDIVGSVYEWRRIKTKSFEFFNDNSFVTDDSVCTAAVADALLHDRSPDAALQDWCRRYPGASYGGSFRSWIWMEPRPSLQQLRQRRRHARLAGGLPEP